MCTTENLPHNASIIIDSIDFDAIDIEDKIQEQYCVLRNPGYLLF